MIARLALRHILGVPDDFRKDFVDDFDQSLSVLEEGNVLGELHHVR